MKLGAVTSKNGNLRRWGTTLLVGATGASLGIVSTPASALGTWPYVNPIMIGHAYRHGVIPMRGSLRTYSQAGVKYDSSANTLTVTGTGVSGGLPVSFVFVALETGPTTPGWVSFVFSDGYTNAGNLLNGSVVLH